MSDKKEISVAESILKGITVEDGKVVVSKEVVEEQLKEQGVSLDDLVKAQTAAIAVTKVIIPAIGQVAVDEMDKNKELDSVAGEFAVGKMATTVNVKRSHEVRANGPGQPVSTKTVVGYTDIHTKIGLGDKAKKDVREYISGYATKKLK